MFPFFSRRISGTDGAARSHNSKKSNSTDERRRFRQICCATSHQPQAEAHLLQLAQRLVGASQPASMREKPASYLSHASQFSSAIPARWPCLSRASARPRILPACPTVGRSVRPPSPPLRASERRNDLWDERARHTVAEHNGIARIFSIARSLACWLLVPVQSAETSQIFTLPTQTRQQRQWINLC